MPRITRLQALVTIAIALAIVAGAMNYAYWQWLIARRAGAVSPVTGPPSGSPASAREIQALAVHLQLNPRDHRARARLSQLYFLDKDYPRALAQLDMLERQQPRNAEVFLLRGIVLKYAGWRRESKSALRRALALRPNYEAAYEWLGELYLDEGRSQDALDSFNRCLKQNPNSYMALMGKARSLEQLFVSRYPIGLSEMISPVEKAVQLSPNNPWGLVTLARMTFNYQSRPEPAEKLALRAAELDPRSAEPYLILAEIALHRPPTPENLRQAGKYALEATRRDPNDPRPPYQFGRALLQQNDAAEAVKYLEASVAIRAMPEAVYQLSIALGRAGNPERAKYYGEIYQKWNSFMERRKTLLGDLQRRPNEVRHYYRIAVLYLEANSPEPAANWLNKARQLRPRDPTHDRLMSQVRRLRAEIRKSSGEKDGPVLSLP